MISVIIPTLNPGARLGPCLGALSPAVLEPMLTEVILADGGSTDETAEAAEALGAVFLPAPRGRGAQLAAGAAAARGEWLLFLHSDTVLSPEWVAAAQGLVAAGPGRAGWFRLRFDAAGAAPRLVAGWANLRARLFALPYGDQGLLIHRALYDRVGGHPAIPLMEDVALARALGRRRLTGLDAEAKTDAARYLRDGWLRRGAANLWLLARYFLGAAPETLARAYR